MKMTRTFEDIMSELDEVRQELTAQAFQSPSFWDDRPAGPAWKGDENLSKLDKKYKALRSEALAAARTPAEVSRVR